MNFGKITTSIINKERKRPCGSGENVLKRPIVYSFAGLGVCKEFHREPKALRINKPDMGIARKITRQVPILGHI